MYKLNEMLLRRKNKVNVREINVIAENSSSNAKAMLLAADRNIESLGYTMSPELCQAILYNYTDDEVRELCVSMISGLKVITGADKQYKPMYPNFPQQVADASDVELFFNAIVHYCTFGTVMPEYEKNERLPLFENTKLTVLTAGTTTDVMEIFSNLLSSKTSLSQQDKDDVAYVISNYPDFYDYLPDEVPLKENVAMLAVLILNAAPIKSVDKIQKYFSTATDVLRFITMLSDGDISLASKTKYRSLRRSERRMVMDLLAGCGNILEDMYRYKNEWIRVGEILHPFEYRIAKYDKVNDAFDKLRNQKKPVFFAGEVQIAILQKDIAKAANLLKNRPGDFARQLDKLLRDADNKNYVLNCFREVASKVSVPVLLQVRQHFVDRNNGNAVRVFFPKGDVAKVSCIENTLPPIDKKVCAAVEAICNHALVEQFKSKDYMGKVYIDEDMRKILVPFSQRSASNASKSLVRGSRIALNPKAKAVRGFIWWTNTGNKEKRSDWYDDNRVDVDLSACIYDANWRYVEHISYTNLRASRYKAYHSGDITNGGPVNGKGVAEFIDFDIDSVAARGRYVVFQIHEYTCHKFSELENCRFGWMERQDVNSGEIFEPSTVDMRIDVNCPALQAIPVIFDCKTREFIWCDMVNKDMGYRWGGNNLESNLKGTTAACYAMAHMSKPDVYTLAALNAEARGYLTSNRNEADVIFSNDTTLPVETVTVTHDDGTTSTEQRERSDVKIVTAYDTDYFMGQLL